MPEDKKNKPNEHSGEILEEKENVKEALNKAEEKIQDKGSTIKETAHEKAEEIKKAANEKGSKIKETAQEKAEEAKKTAHEKESKVKETVQEAKHKGQHFNKYLHKTFEGIKHSETVNELRSYTTGHKEETFAVAVILIGLIITTWLHTQTGLTLIGLVLGVYFFDEIIDIAKNLKPYYLTAGIFKAIILVGLFLALLISVPFLIIGTAVSVGAKFLLEWHRHKA
ncbi:MAG: hypothetical protein ACQEP8_03815 [Chlamydiota bacterium]